MNKLKMLLPAFAILLAAVVLTTEIGSSLGAQTPVQSVPTDSDSANYTSDDSDISAASWVETGGNTVDTRKPRLPVKGQAARRK